MRKLLASIKKEALLLLHDKIGLMLMYLMPILLVFIITIVQNSAFQLVTENSLDILIVNHDKGALGDSLTKMLESSGSFSVEKERNLSFEQIKKETIDRKKLMSIYIPEEFSNQLLSKAGHISNMMLAEFGVTDKKTHQVKKEKSSQIVLFYDPVLQENFRLSLTNSLNTVLSGLENQNMIRQLFLDMGYKKIPKSIEKELIRKQTDIKTAPASSSNSSQMPNSTQHNVPAWSLFAMFFMVISLGGNLVKERLSGSFIRLQTIPSAFFLVICSKIAVYLFVALSQLFILFSLGVFVFPLIGLPQLNIPPNILPILVISILSALAAISYALMVGTYAKTQEQANGFGAISIIIFAAIGGIWVPSFIMPAYLQTIGKASPLHWCIEGFYTLFLKNGTWSELSGTIIYLLLFTFICQFLTFVKLRLQNYI
jgi:ABC-2 type transport system permease protein